jgi:hypothetical protein
MNALRGLVVFRNRDNYCYLFRQRIQLVYAPNYKAVCHDQQPSPYGRKGGLDAIAGGGSYAGDGWAVSGPPPFDAYQSLQHGEKNRKLKQKKSTQLKNKPFWTAAF